VDIDFRFEGVRVYQVTTTKWAIPYPIGIVDQEVMVKQRRESRMFIKGGVIVTKVFEGLMIIMVSDRPVIIGFAFQEVLVIMLHNQRVMTGIIRLSIGNDLVYPRESSPSLFRLSPRANLFMPASAVLDLDAIVIFSSEESEPYQRADHIIRFEVLQSIHEALGCDSTDFFVPDVWIPRGANELSNCERG
jgi:hypothetical protein